ncbi:hypothetical protein [Streptomyces zagrosensis]|uniref:Uncharacterized protein n=1 Tax=Streptomyces zagrosensis TaxID=1042984 RepID=A0A7W9QDH2_9ACTN|nr:hypothetical protein [Streptomyces zagrosensis]MBB5937944.1 hypothetical protein [Streptomyces zagrosensis]
MIRVIRSAAWMFLIGSLGYYVWHGFNGEPMEPGVPVWVGPQMIPLIIAVSLVPVVLAFTKDGVLSALTGKNSAAFRKGLVGVGTVKSASPTGTTINDQPELRVELSVRGAGGVTFESHAKMVVAITEVALLKPGTVLPVRYVPGRTDRVELDRSGDAAQAQAVLDQEQVRRGLTTPETLDVAERGTAAQAVVRSLDVSGVVRDGYPQLDITLVVTRPDGTTFETEVQKFLPPHAVQLVQVGRVIRVLYLPGDESRIALALPANL